MMLDACRAIVLAALLDLNLKGTFTEEKDAGAMKARPYAVLLWGDEDLQSSRRRRGHTDDSVAGTRTIHRQVARRTIVLQIRLVAETTAHLDDLIIRFLAALPRKVQDPTSGIISLTLQGAETPVTDGVVRREARWEGTVEFTAPIIQNSTVPLFSLGTALTIETEIDP